MKKQILTALILLTGFNISLSQDYIHCHELRTLVQIPDSNNIPNVTTNTNGTITLTFPQQSVTDIFANYDIFDFYPAAISSFYYIKHNSKSLFEDLQNNVSPTIIGFDTIATDSIHQDLINILDGETFRVVKTVGVTDPSSCTDFFGNDLCPYQDVPSNSNLEFSFTYDIVSDSFLVESTQNTICGNFFSITMKGGNPNDNVNNIPYTLQTWETTVGVSAFNPPSNPCHFTENRLFGIMGVYCDYDYFYGNVNITIDPVTNNLKFTRDMVLLGYEGIELVNTNTNSLEESEFIKLIPYLENDTFLLNIKNFENQSLDVEVFDINGKQIIGNTKYQPNQIDFSTFSNGVYFIRIIDEKQIKTYKIVKD